MDFLIFFCPIKSLSTKYILGWQSLIANSNNFLQTHDANGQMSKTIFFTLYLLSKNYLQWIFPISKENSQKTNTVTLLRKENTICRVTDNLIKGDGCCHTPAQLLAPKAFWSLKMATMLTRRDTQGDFNGILFIHELKKIPIPKSRKSRCFGKHLNTNSDC